MSHIITINDTCITIKGVLFSEKEADTIESNFKHLEEVAITEKKKVEEQGKEIKKLTTLNTIQAVTILLLGIMGIINILAINQIRVENKTQNHIVEKIVSIMENEREDNE